VAVDREQCIGSGSCAGIAPLHFRLTGDRAEPVAELIAPDDSVRGAADVCPAEAITVADAATGALIAPEV
jgi:ferredoxin